MQFDSVICFEQIVYKCVEYTHQTVYLSLSNLVYPTLYLIHTELEWCPGLLHISPPGV